MQYIDEDYSSDENENDRKRRSMDRRKAIEKRIDELLATNLENEQDVVFLLRNARKQRFQQIPPDKITTKVLHDFINVDHDPMFWSPIPGIICDIFKLYPEKVTEEMAVQCFKNFSFEIYKIPRESWTPNICKQAVFSNIGNFLYLPQEHISGDILDFVQKNYKEYCNRWKTNPPNLNFNHGHMRSQMYQKIGHKLDNLEYTCGYLVPRN